MSGHITTSYIAYFDEELHRTNTAVVVALSELLNGFSTAKKEPVITLAYGNENIACHRQVTKKKEDKGKKFQFFKKR